MALKANRKEAFRFAILYGANIHMDQDSIEARLPDHLVWDFSGTSSVISSLDTGETEDDLWNDITEQMAFGVKPRGA